VWAGGKPTSVIPLRKQHAVLVISGISSAELSLPAYLLYCTVLPWRCWPPSKQTPAGGHHQQVITSMACCYAVQGALLARRPRL
jgi:hypothetical protein